MQEIRQCLLAKLRNEKCTRETLAWLEFLTNCPQGNVIANSFLDIFVCQELFAYLSIRIKAVYMYIGINILLKENFTLPCKYQTFIQKYLH